MALILQRGVRGDERVQGHGIGLAIVQDLVRGYRGTLEVLPSLELGGARIHGDNHVQYNCEGYVDVSVASSHMWTEGLLEYHFLSGHPRALEMARSLGDCLLRLMDHGWGIPPYKVIWHSVRDSGWPLIALAALYEATREEKWLAGCRRLVDALLAAWQQDEDWGLWLGWRSGTR